jgi:hypothetical protein
MDPDGVSRAGSSRELNFEIAGAQHELDQFAHADSQIGFQHTPPRHSNTQLRFAKKTGIRKIRGKPPYH